MSGIYRIEENLKKFKEIKEKYPNSTHVYMKRSDMDGAILDIPMNGVEFTIHQHPAWEVVMSAQQMDKEIEQIFKDDVSPMLAEAEKNAEEITGEQADSLATGIGACPVVPKKPSELFMCEQCEFIAKSAFGLSVHQRRHYKENAKK